MGSRVLGLSPSHSLLRLRPPRAPTTSFLHSRGGLRCEKIACSMKSYKLSELSSPELESLNARPRINFSSIFTTVNPIVEDVRRRGDSAVLQVAHQGVRCKRVARGIGSVGLYVPGGTAVLPSTALMLAIPAKIAGCRTVVLATPPSSDGSICKVLSTEKLKESGISSGDYEFLWRFQ